MRGRSRLCNCQRQRREGETARAGPARATRKAEGRAGRRPERKPKARRRSRSQFQRTGAAGERWQADPQDRPKGREAILLPGSGAAGTLPWASRRPRPKAAEAQGCERDDWSERNRKAEGRAGRRPERKPKARRRSRSLTNGQAEPVNGGKPIRRIARRVAKRSCCRAAAQPERCPGRAEGQGRRPQKPKAASVTIGRNATARPKAAQADRPKQAQARIPSIFCERHPPETRCCVIAAHVLERNRPGNRRRW